METLNVAEAKSRFSEVISRAAAGTRFLVQRRNRPVAVVLGASDLERLERASQAAHRLAASLGQSERILERIEKGELHPAMAAYGLWHDEPDLADLVDEIYEGRRSSIDEP